MTTTSGKPVVLLLHDQFQDARIWGEFQQTIAEFATPQSVDVRPLHVISPSQWADNLVWQVRESVADPIDFVFTVGGAGLAGVALLREHDVGRAVLLDPPRTPLYDKGVPIRRSSEPDDSPAQGVMDELVIPYAEEMASGHYSEELIQKIAELNASTDDNLSSQNQQLVKMVYADQYRVSMPLGASPPAPPGTHWAERVSSVAERCTVVLSDYGPVHAEQLREVLTYDYPRLAVVRIETSSPHAWLHKPRELSDILHGLV